MKITYKKDVRFWHTPSPLLSATVRYWQKPLPLQPGRLLWMAPNTKITPKPEVIQMACKYGFENLKFGL